MIYKKRDKWFVEDKDGNKHKFQSMEAAQAFEGIPTVKEVVAEEVVELEEEAEIWDKD